MSNSFILLVGLPGCGKSTWCKNQLGLGSDLKPDSEGLLFGAYKGDPAVIISSDALRESLGKDPGTGHIEVFAKMLEYTKYYLTQEYTVFYDATNMSRKHRMALLQSISKYPGKRLCVLFIEPVDICKARDKEREPKWVVGADVIHHMLCSFNVPMLYEGFDAIYVLRSSLLDSEVLNNWLDQMKGFDQENSHHTLDLYNHSVKVQEYVKSHLTDISDDSVVPYLLKAALYHDLGKLWTKQFFNAKAEKTTEAHYYNHEHVGAYRYLEGSVKPMEVLDSAATYYDDLFVASLIDWHMRRYQTLSERKRNHEQEMLKGVFSECLDLLHAADKAAH